MTGFYMQCNTEPKDRFNIVLQLVFNWWNTHKIAIFSGGKLELVQ